MATNETFSNTSSNSNNIIHVSSNSANSSNNNRFDTSSINNSDSSKGISDEDFMAVIKDFPAVYDRRSEAFKDKAFKEEAWEKIAEYFDMRIEDVKRRYDTIRTRLSRYLKKAKEGYWINDTSNIMDSKIDFMNWLVPHIKTRESSILNSENMRRDIMLSNLAGTEFTDHTSGNDKRTEQLFFGGGSTSIEDSTTEDRISMIQIAENNSNRRSVTSHDSDEQRDEKPPLISLLDDKKEFHKDFSTRKRKYNNNIPAHKHESDEEDYRHRLKNERERNSRFANHNEQLRPSQNFDPKMNDGYDEDDHYCKSLVGRFKRLDSKHKAYLRSTIEKAFFDIELGYVQFPKQSSNDVIPSTSHLQS